MDESLKHQVIKSVEYTYIYKLHNNYTGFMGANSIDLIHHMMDRYGNIIKTDLKDYQKMIFQSLDTAITIDKYFDIIGDLIQYSDKIKHPYTASQIINNMVLATGLNTEPIKNLVQEYGNKKIWIIFLTFFAK